MIKEYYCPLFKKTISYGRCVDINYELEKIIKENELKFIRRILVTNNKEIQNICIKCLNYPLEK